MSVTLEFLDSVQSFLHSIFLYIQNTLIPLILVFYDWYFTNNFTILISVVIPISYWLIRVYKSQKKYRPIWKKYYNYHKKSKIRLMWFVLTESFAWSLVQAVVLLILLGVFFLIAGWFCLDSIVECDNSVLENNRFKELLVNSTRIFSNPFSFR